MSTVLSGMQGLKCLVYLDDITVFEETLKVHNDKLREVFARPTHSLPKSTFVDLIISILNTRQ
jgi:hypothetical protein